MLGALGCSTQPAETLTSELSFSLDQAWVAGHPFAEIMRNIFTTHASIAAMVPRNMVIHRPAKNTTRSGLGYNTLCYRTRLLSLRKPRVAPDAHLEVQELPQEFNRSLRAVLLDHGHVDIVDEDHDLKRRKTLNAVKFRVRQSFPREHVGHVGHVRRAGKGQTGTRKSAKVLWCMMTHEVQGQQSVGSSPRCLPSARVLCILL